MRAKTWFATVPSADILQAQAAFIRRFIGTLFADIDCGSLSGVKSAHFHRLNGDVRFRILASESALPPIIALVEARLVSAQTDGLITHFRSDQVGSWTPPDANYGTDIPEVVDAFTQFLEAVSRATVALLASTAGSAVHEPVLWNWLHLVHNPMTGIQRDLVEIPSGSHHTL